MTSCFIQALQKKNKGRPPVWLMRQAGRYLPEYQELRRRYSLRDLFLTPDLAALVTHMPIDRFGMDAAILFSDITIVALAIGLELDFQEGPRVNPEVTPFLLSSLGCFPEKLEPVMQAIRLLKKSLAVPLLGFAGAPFTVASYLIGGLEKTLFWMRSDPLSFTVFIDHIVRVTSIYLQMQEKEGVDAIQIFDSWANVLSPEEHQIFCLKPLELLRREVSVPVLFFMRECGAYIEKIPCGISLDWTVSLKDARSRTDQVLQGNLNPDFLFLPLPDIRAKTLEILDSMNGDPGFILNLGHGVKVGTPVDAVECFVDTARNYVPKLS